MQVAVRFICRLAKKLSNTLFGGASKSLDENHTRFGNDKRNDIYLTKTFNHNSCLSGRKSMAVYELIII